VPDPPGVLPGAGEVPDVPGLLPRLPVVSLGAVLLGPPGAVLPPAGGAGGAADGEPGEAAGGVPPGDPVRGVSFRSHAASASSAEAATARARGRCMTFSF
jgi:hypothetical protein